MRLKDEGRLSSSNSFTEKSLEPAPKRVWSSFIANGVTGAVNLITSTSEEPWDGQGSLCR